jgi:hypothetical protein
MFFNSIISTVEIIRHPMWWEDEYEWSVGKEVVMAYFMVLSLAFAWRDGGKSKNT